MIFRNKPYSLPNKDFCSPGNIKMEFKSEKRDDGNTQIKRRATTPLYCGNGRGEVIEIKIIKSPSLGKRARKHKEARTELITP